MKSGNLIIQEIARIRQSIAFWEKVAVVFLLLSGITFFLGINSFSAAFAEKNSTKASTSIAFKGTHDGRAISMALPKGGKIPTTHKLGVNLGAEERVM